MALMFAGKNEFDESVLIVNSIEYSDRLRQEPHKGLIIGTAVEYIKEYAVASRFTHHIMGNHRYNPAKDSIKEGKIGFERVIKINPWQESFYADVLTNGEGSTDSFGLL